MPQIPVDRLVARLDALRAGIHAPVPSSSAERLEKNAAAAGLARLISELREIAA